jgi:hypothetical protein
MLCVCARVCAPQLNELYTQLQQLRARRSANAASSDLVPGVSREDVLSSWFRGVVAVLTPIVWSPGRGVSVAGDVPIHTAVVLHPTVFNVVIVDADTGAALRDDVSDVPATALAMTLQEYSDVLGLHGGQFTLDTLFSVLEQHATGGDVPTLQVEPSQAVAVRGARTAGIKELVAGSGARGWWIRVRNHNNQRTADVVAARMSVVSVDSREALAARTSMASGGVGLSATPDAAASAAQQPAGDPDDTRHQIFMRDLSLSGTVLDRALKSGSSVHNGQAIARAG